MTDVDLFSQAEMQHEMLMQLEAIIFASDAPVSLARLKEAFQDQYSKLVYLNSCHLCLLEM